MIRLFPNYYPRYNQIFTRTNIQNGALTSKDAMPLKDSTTTDDSNFSIDRRKYTRINQVIPQNQIPAIHSTIFGEGKNYMETNVYTGHIVGQTNTVKSNNDYQKKWYGNRDASQIVSNRRVQAVGKGSLNPTGTSISFTTKNDRNTQRDAKKRVRSGGASVPAKVIHKYKNAPIFY
jgi:hypothetical protein